MSKQKDQKKCFVVMGFGKKTDLATNREIDLDKSYKLLIKPVVEAKGIECVRADEIVHSGVIDVPMYQQLLTADLVIADISTANPNAIYELGIRHALKPYTTIVMSENKLKYPFDLNHILITSYAYLDGGGIDFDEVMRFRGVLGEKIDKIMKSPETDSPVYTYVNGLTPPSLIKKAAGKVALAMRGAGGMVPEAASRDLTPPADGPTLAELMEQGERAIREDKFSLAKEKFAKALKLFEDRQKGADPKRGEDPYLLQRLALATYKAKPSDVKALNGALKVLAPLKPLDSNDPETVGLAGAIEKRLFARTGAVDHLAHALRYYSRGYTLRDDYYNGINLAYLLNVRTGTSLDATDQDRIADLVVANRTRREVLALCNAELMAIEGRRQREVATREATPPELDQFRKDQQERDQERSFWCLAAKAEAHFGLGEAEPYQATRALLRDFRPAQPKWMVESFETQIGRLRTLLDQHGHLLRPRWSMP